MSERKIVLVTGASSGIGQAIARLLAQKGFIVFGTSRNPSDGEKRSGIEVLPLEVRSEDSVQACVNAVLTKAGRLDILINNAGYELAGAIEDTSIAEAKSQFETNFFGVMRLVNAVLPLMRQQRSGQIINIGSIVGVVPVPFLGAYSASKFAVEGYTEILRHEVRPLNIRVSLVEPGFIKTNLASNRQYAANRIRDYDPWRQRT
jgi:NAD(P)-dependent dehydrogenase (short-subunit alcohol dehydrogenase family)